MQGTLALPALFHDAPEQGFADTTICGLLVVECRKMMPHVQVDLQKIKSVYFSKNSIVQGLKIL
jgi:hypothetical protein